LELARIDGGAVHLTVPTKFLKSWVQSHYAPRIKARVASEFSKVERVVIDVRSPMRKARSREDGADQVESNTPHCVARAVASFAPALEAANEGNARRAARPMTLRHDADAFVGSPLDRRLSFSTFLVGPSNQLAYAAACRVAEARSGDLPMFNPLYAHAAVGLGKTHLLQALAHASNDNRRHTIYLTAERFMSGFVSSLTTHTSLAFKEKLRGIDVLIIDDEPAARQMIAAALTKAGFGYREASGGAQGLEMARAARPIAIQTARGVASPSAHGQAMSVTARPVRIPSSSPSR